MAAVMTTARPTARPAAVQPPARIPSRPHLTLVAAPPATVPQRRVSIITFRRRRLAVALAVVVVVLAAGRAGAALGSSPLAAPERRPSVTQYVVAPGDSLWSVARHVAPHDDPRPVVDALARTRGGAPLLPGETITWPR